MYTISKAPSKLVATKTRRGKRNKIYKMPNEMIPQFITATSV